MRWDMWREWVEMRDRVELRCWKGSRGNAFGRWDRERRRKCVKGWEEKLMGFREIKWWGIEVWE